MAIMVMPIPTAMTQDKKTFCAEANPERLLMPPVKGL